MPDLITWDVRGQVITFLMAWTSILVSFLLPALPGVGASPSQSSPSYANSCAGLKERLQLPNTTVKPRKDLQTGPPLDTRGGRQIVSARIMNRGRASTGA